MEGGRRGDQRVDGGIRDEVDVTDHELVGDGETALVSRVVPPQRSHERVKVSGSVHLDPLKLRNNLRAVKVDVTIGETDQIGTDVTWQDTKMHDRKEGDKLQPAREQVAGAGVAGVLRTTDWTCNKVGVPHDSEREGIRQD